MLQEFRLRCSSILPDYATLWTSYAIARSVRVLFLDVCLVEEYTQDRFLPVHLPGTLFTCGTLQVLNIGSYFKLQVPSVVCLPKLQVLVLRELSFESKECIPNLTRGCPVLHSLEIITYHMDRIRDIKIFSHSLRRVKILAYEWDVFDSKLEIDAPNVEHLYLDEKFSEISVKRFNSVDFVALYVDVFPSDNFVSDGVAEGLYIDHCDSVVKLLEAMNGVRYMTLKGTLLYALSYAGTPLDVCFERLTKLDVGIDCCHWSSLGVVLGCSPKLQVLNITKIRCLKSSHKLCWSDPTKAPECLEKASIVGFKGLGDEMAMVKYILQHCQVLESFTLKFSADLDDDYKSRFLVARELLTFLRSSQACVILLDFD